MKFLIAASLLLCSCSLWADQVTLANGDRITGSVLRSDSKTLVMKTDTAGEVTLKWDSVAGISAPGPLYIGLAEGQMIAGSVETVNGTFNVTTKTAPREPQAAYERSLPSRGIGASYNLFEALPRLRARPYALPAVLVMRSPPQGLHHQAFRTTDPHRSRP